MYRFYTYTTSNCGVRYHYEEQVPLTPLDTFKRRVRGTCSSQQQPKGCPLNDIVLIVKGIVGQIQKYYSQMIVSKEQNGQRQTICDQFQQNNIRYAQGKYPNINLNLSNLKNKMNENQLSKSHNTSGVLSSKQNIIFLEKNNKITVFSEQDFKGNKRIYFGNNNYISLDLDVKSLKITKFQQPLILYFKTLNLTNQTQQDTLWFPCGVFSDSVKYGFDQHVFLQYYQLVDPQYEMQLFQSGFQVVSKDKAPDVIIQIQDQSPLKIYSEHKYTGIKFPQTFNIEFLNSDIKLDIFPSQTGYNDCFMVIYQSVQDLNPMESHYNLRIAEKQVFDIILNNGFNINLCNNKTKQILYNSVLIVLIIISINIMLHTYIRQSDYNTIQSTNQAIIQKN